MQQLEKPTAHNPKDKREWAFEVAVLSLVIVAGTAAIAWGPLVFEARASTASVTVTWVIPTDKTIAVSYPTGLTASRFSPALSSFARQVADSQTDGVGSFAVTNNGNVAVTISGVFTGSFATGIAEYRIANASSSGVPSTGQIWWCGATSDTGQSPAGSCSGSANATTSRTMMGTAQTLAAGATHTWWAWSWGTTVAAGTVSDTLTLTGN